MPRTFLASLGVLFFLLPQLSQAEFYSFEGNSKPRWQDPAEIMEGVARPTADLLKWAFHQAPRPLPLEKYNRLKHFGAWVDDIRTPECYDTRALVLIRDSEEDVKFSQGNHCKAFSGGWTDPYGGSYLKTAREVEIDHVVALKNAYVSGAWAWDYQHRCLYANFLGYDKHLLAVSVFENRSKSDRGPEAWMPSDPDYACQHLQNWLVVKFIWNLTMTQEEAQAIRDEIQENRCEEKGFRFSKSEINRIRSFAQANLELCPAGH